MPDQRKVNPPPRRHHDAGEPAVRGDDGGTGVSQPVSVDLKKAEALVA
jgi:hypothetical protein